MRCARCDRLAIPQAVGQTPDGRVVFGWCLDCMAEKECRRIRIAPGRRGFRRLKPPRPRRVATVAERRATGLALVALPLLLWGATFAVVGTWKALRPLGVPAQPLGPGAPVVLIVGGAALAVAGLVLAGVAFARVAWFWRLLEGVLFACAVLALMSGVVQHDPKRAPWMVALAVFAVALSGLVHQRRRFMLGPAPPPNAPGELL